jgi:hypothetical protein
MEITRSAKVILNWSLRFLYRKMATSAAENWTTVIMSRGIWVVAVRYSTERPEEAWPLKKENLRVRKLQAAASSNQMD